MPSNQPSDVIRTTLVHLTLTKSVRGFKCVHILLNSGTPWATRLGEYTVKENKFQRLLLNRCSRGKEFLTGDNEKNEPASLCTWTGQVPPLLCVPLLDTTEQRIKGKVPKSCPGVRVPEVGISWPNWRPSLS